MIGLEKGCSLFPANPFAGFTLNRVRLGLLRQNHDLHLVRITGM